MIARTADAGKNEMAGSLPRDEQYAVYETIARSVTPGDYGPLSDDDLMAIAAQTFSLLDEEESRAQSR